jgi:hypothetical protein
VVDKEGEEKCEAAVIRCPAPSVRQKEG